MIFRQDSIDLIRRCLKTQTRRPVQGWERMQVPGGGGVLLMPRECDEIDAVYMAKPGKTRLKWQLLRTYAMSPGRGKHQVERFRLCQLRCQKLESMTIDDVLAEGMKIIAAPTRDCVGIYQYGLDRTPSVPMFQAHSCQEAYFDLLKMMYPKVRPEDLFWVLDFELVKT